MDFVDILRELGIDFREAGEHHHVRPGWIGLPCPYCGSQNFHLGYSLSGGFLTCWRCGPHNVVNTLHELSGQTKDIIKRQIGDASLQIGPERKEVSGILKMPDAVNQMTMAHKVYLRSRNIGPKYAARIWKLQGIGANGGFLAWRIFLPIYYRGVIVSWTTRAIGTGIAKRYHSASPEQEKISHKNLLFGHDHVRHAAIICEGPFDAIRIGPGAVATMGTNYSQAQLMKIAQFPVRAICFDSQPDAQMRARQLGRSIESFPGDTQIVELESGKDAGDADDDEIRELRSKFLR